MLIAYLPKEKILFTADFNAPAAGPARQPVDCDADGQSRSAGDRLRAARHRARAESGSRADEGGSVRTREEDQSMKRLVDGARARRRRARHASARQRARCWRTTRSPSTTSRRTPSKSRATSSSSSTGTRTRGFSCRGRRGPFGQPKIYAAEWVSVSQLDRAGIPKNFFKPGDSLRIWASPNKNPTDNRVRLKRMERRSDGWKWLGNRGDTR